MTRAVSSGASQRPAEALDPAPARLSPPAGRLLGCAVFCRLLSGLALFCLALAAPGAHASPPCPDGTVIAPGDTLAAIARRCDTSVEALQQANPGVSDPRRLRSGQRLVVPERRAEGQGSAGIRRSPAASANRGSRGREGLTQDAVQPPPRGVQSLMIEPRSGSAGSRVTLFVAGLPNGPAQVGVGILGADREQLVELQIPDDGRAEVVVTVPGWVRPDDEVGFSIRDAVGGVLESGSFQILPAQRTRRDEGEILPGEGDAGLSASGVLRQGLGCTLLETAQGHLYGLSSGRWSFTPGAQVNLAGQPADHPVCTGTRGTIEVSWLRPAAMPATANGVDPGDSPAARDSGTDPGN